MNGEIHMKSYIIKGNNYLQGEVNVSGSKNLALPLLALAVLIRKKIILNNIPNIKDITNFLNIFSYLNIKYKWIDKNVLFIDASSFAYKPLLIDEVSRIRASYYLIGALLPSVKILDIKYPGGCDFEKRPIDIHLDMFKDFGSKIEESEILHFEFNGFKSKNIKLKNISFGATINAILMALNSNEDVVIENISSECEVDAFIDIINSLGGVIKKTNNTLFIKSKGELNGGEINNIPSRMEIGTFALIGASLGKVRIHPVIRGHLSSIEEVLKSSNVFYYFVNDTLVVEKRKKPESIVVETGNFPAFPTDLQPVLTSYLLSIPKIHVIKETIYKNRFSHVDELKKLGAMILKENNAILINGIFLLHGAEMEAKDLRSAASLVLGALIAKGESRITNMDYIDRGYEEFYEKLRNLGADIGVSE